MTIIDRMELQLRSARDALERIHVLGAESTLMSGALLAIGNVIEVIGRIKEEETKNADQSRREDACSEMDLSRGSQRRDETDDGAGKHRDDCENCAGS